MIGDIKLEEVTILTPRVELTHVYPSCPFKVGDILIKRSFEGNVWYTTDKEPYGNAVHEDDIKKASENFRELAWYEYRTLEELPEYIQFGGMAVYKVKYDLERKIDGRFWAWCSDLEDYPLHFADNKSAPSNHEDYLISREYLKNKYTPNHPATKMHFEDFFEFKRSGMSCDDFLNSKK